jgi:hypothetical protein
VRGESRIDDRFVVDACEFDIHQGSSETNVVDSGGDANAIRILTSYFDVVRTHESHAAGVSRGCRHGIAGICLAGMEKIVTAQNLKRTDWPGPTPIR